MDGRRSLLSLRLALSVPARVFHDARVRRHGLLLLAPYLALRPSQLVAASTQPSHDLISDLFLGASFVERLVTDFSREVCDADLS